MKQLKTTAVALMTFLVFVGCVKGGTGTGNPMGEAHYGPPPNEDTPTPSEVLSSKLCSKLTQCFPESHIIPCLEAIRGLPGLPQYFGSKESTLYELYKKELTGEVRCNGQTPFICLENLSALECADPNVIASFDATALNPYENIGKMIPTSRDAGCSEIYK